MNTPIKLGEGSLTMCDIWDFRDTMRPEHEVVTLSRYLPNYHSADKIWVHAVGIVIDLLEDGKDVLLHCVHGRDRTGGVAYVVLRLQGFTHEEAHAKMVEVRPSQEEAWATKIPMRRPLYDKIIEEYLNQDRERR